MAIPEKNTNKKCWWGWGAKGTLLQCCMNVNWYSHCGHAYEVSQKIKYRTAIGPRIPFLDIYPKETKTRIPKDTCFPIFIAALLTTAKIQKKPKCPSIDEWINIYIVKYHLAINEILPFATTWMDFEGTELSELSQTEKNKYCTVSLICGI